MTTADSYSFQSGTKHHYDNIEVSIIPHKLRHLKQKKNNLCRSILPILTCRVVLLKLQCSILLFPRPLIASCACNQVQILSICHLLVLLKEHIGVSINTKQKLKTHEVTFSWSSSWQTNSIINNLFDSKYIIHLGLPVLSNTVGKSLKTKEYIQRKIYSALQINQSYSHSVFHKNCKNIYV